MNFVYKVSIARLFYAIAIIALGVQHFLFKDFIAGRAPAWPKDLAGQVLLAYITGSILILGGVATLIQKNARAALTIVGILILLWAGLRNLYAVLVALDYGGLLTNTCKALSLGFGAFVIAQTFAPEKESAGFTRFIRTMAQAGRYALGLFLFIAGIQHFLFADFVKFLIPAWIPAPLLWTYLSGIALFIAGLAILTGVKASLAANLAGIMVFSWLLVLHIPRAIAEANQNEETAVLEALAFSGLLFAVAVLLDTKRRSK